MVTLTLRVAAFTALASVLVWGRPAMAQPRATLSPRALDLGAVLQGTRIDATFRVRNDGSAPLVLRRADMTPPLVAAKLPAVIPPGSEVTLVFALDTTRLRGSFEGTLALTTDPEVSGLEATVACRVVRPVEAYPPVLFIVGQRGEGREATVEIVNHGDAPLQLLAIDHASQRLTARADVLEDGRRFRVTVRLRPDGPGGRQTETLSIRTSSASMPTLGLVVNSYLRERVYTFPEAVDLGTLQWADVERSPDLLDRTAQTLMVYQVGGNDFAASFSSDIPGLAIAAARGPQGDRWQVLLKLDRAAVVPGMIRGALRIDTNDPDFPRLVIPVAGDIVGAPEPASATSAPRGVGRRDGSSEGR